jgi:hypothetical protein
MVLLTGLVLALTSCAPTPQLTEQKLDHIMNLRESQLAELAEGLGLDRERPIPDLVQWVTSDASAALWSECIKERNAALPATIVEGGDQARVAIWECRAKYSLDPRTQEPLTTAQYFTMYHYYYVDLRDCLAKRGFEGPPAPRFDDFIADYQRGFLWTPYLMLAQGNMSAESWAKLNAECPHTPPATELYGPPLPQP